MLILTRKTGQGFTIGDDIEITITEVSGDKVRVGINAPREVKILRSELTQTLEANVEASASANRQSLRALALGLKKGGEASVPKPAPEDGAGQPPKEKPAPKG